MCSNFRLHAANGEIARAMGVALVPATPPVPADVFPRRRALVVRAAAGDRIAETMVWGVAPPPGVRGPVINVRNLGSPFWRAALANPAQRCLIPASQFCEWGAENGQKQRHWFTIAALPVFAFAGIWQPAAPDLLGAGDNDFALLTCAPNARVAAVHPKAMPVILAPADQQRWLSAPMDAALALAAPFPAALMAMA